VEPAVKTPELATQVLYHVGMDEKMPLLVGILEREEWEQALIFVNTRWMAEEVTRRLEENGHKAGLLSGAVDQSKRLQLMEQFKKRELPILVATDVASRGLHIDGISHVINYDLPQDKEEYVHRVGRTARAGKTGKVITLACEKYVEKLPEIEEFLGMKIPTARFEASELGQDKSRPRHRAPFRRPFPGKGGGGPRRGPPRRPGGRRR
jgi:ATP-dependent RNA helicase RhlB